MSDECVIEIPNVFSVDACEALVERSEEIGFEFATVRTPNGPKAMPHIRNNERAEFLDEALAEELFSAIVADLPKIDGQLPVGVDANFRVYKYVPGQIFKRHKDGVVVNDAGQTSKLSCLLYLNESMEGGATTFREYVGKDRTPKERIVVPRTGAVLAFAHKLWHEGSPLQSGCKYVLRTDIFFE